MPLVIEDEVRVLLREDATGLPDDQVTPHIITADLIITEDFAASTATTARKKQIELYLAAHFAVLAHERGGLSEERIGSSSEALRRISAGVLGLSSTRFGQQALALDTEGILREMEDRATATPPTTSRAALFRVV